MSFVAVCAKVQSMFKTRSKLDKAEKLCDEAVALKYYDSVLREIDGDACVCLFGNTRKSRKKRAELGMKGNENVKQRENRSEVDEREGNRVVEAMGSVLNAPAQRRGSRKSRRIGGIGRA